MSDELRRLAKEATPGPWYAEVEDEGAMLATRVGSEGHRRGVADFAFIFGGVGPDQALAAADARYLAAASPDVILGLLDRIAELERTIAAAGFVADHWREMYLIEHRKGTESYKVETT